MCSGESGLLVVLGELRVFWGLLCGCGRRLRGVGADWVCLNA